MLDILHASGLAGCCSILPDGGAARIGLPCPPDAC
jgi:hypothetical protein